MLVSSSDGFWRDGLVAAILLRALILSLSLEGKFEISRKDEIRGVWRYVRYSGQ